MEHDCSTCTKREECPATEPGTFCAEYSSGREIERTARPEDAWTGGEC